MRRYPLSFKYDTATINEGAVKFLNEKFTRFNRDKVRGKDKFYSFITQNLSKYYKSIAEKL